VVKRDIERAVTEQARKEVPAPPPAAPPAVAPPPPTAAPPPAGETVALSPMRKTIARRLTEAKQTVPHFYLTAEADVEELWQFRARLNEAGDIKVSFNDLVVKALARALRKVPSANASFAGDNIVRYGRVDIGVAVAIEDGLITPVVRDADKKSIGAIAAEAHALAERARQKRLKPEEYQGATFSISNLGMYGIREFFAIINPPESGILAVGQIEKRPVVVEKDGGDEVVIRRRMTLTLSCDHRVVDGALGAQLLREVIAGLERPLSLVL
jgi:pyruvate dehydrogenase E2 component (dihydrolipoamide acetyltransferase)